MSPLTVIIAVLTYRRPEELRALLPHLLDQAAAASDHVSVLVIDNDPEQSARGIGTVYAADGVRYVPEPVPGISAARNRALDSSGDAELLIYIDDDEHPSPEWLSLLLATYRDERPAAVVGPVISRYTREPEAWIRAGRFFERRRLPTGTEVEVAATNNLLLDLHQLAGLRFDADFGISGGSDTLFTRQLVQQGGRIVWCDEAIVVDVVPPSRLTRSWVLGRAFRSGNSWSRTSLRLARNAPARLLTRLRLSAQGLARLAAGSLQRVLGSLTRADHLQAGGWRRANRGGGMLTGAWGYVYSEYRRS